MSRAGAAAAPVFPVSVKGVVLVGGQVVLLRNERSEWELPGGRLEAGESPAACVARECREELAIEVAVADLLDCWVYEVVPGRHVVIVTYGCHHRGGAVAISSEHNAVGLFHLGEIDALPMPDGYRRSIRDWHGRQALLSGSANAENARFEEDSPQRRKDTKD